MTTLNRRHMGNVAPVLVAVADHMVIEECLHGKNLVAEVVNVSFTIYE
jgi:hypothetical protein